MTTVEEIYAEFRELEGQHGPFESARRRKLWRMLDRVDRGGESSPLDGTDGLERRDDAGESSPPAQNGAQLELEVSPAS